MIQTIQVKFLEDHTLSTSPELENLLASDHSVNYSLEQLSQDLQSALSTQLTADVSADNQTRRQRLEFFPVVLVVYLVLLAFGMLFIMRDTANVSASSSAKSGKPLGKIAILVLFVVAAQVGRIIVNRQAAKIGAYQHLHQVLATPVLQAATRRYSSSPSYPVFVHRIDLWRGEFVDVINHLPVAATTSSGESGNNKIDLLGPSAYHEME